MSVVIRQRERGRPRIVADNRRADFKKGKANRIHFCLLANLKCNDHEDMVVLSRWIAYFKKINVPFVVMEHSGLRHLFKLRRV